MGRLERVVAMKGSKGKEVGKYWQRETSRETMKGRILKDEER